MTPSKGPLTKLPLPTTLVSELNVWRDAFSRVRGRNVTYSEVIRTLLEHIPETEPEILAEVEKMGKNNPELFDKLGKYKERH